MPIDADRGVVVFRQNAVADKPEIKNVREVEIGKGIQQIEMVCEPYPETFEVRVRRFKKDSCGERQGQGRQPVDADFDRKGVEFKIIKIIKHERGKGDVRKDGILIRDFRVPPQVYPVKRGQANRRKQKE